MKELFVPYPIALLAKEKGFDEPCLAFYAPGEKLYPVMQEPAKGSYFNDGNFDETLRAPLYQQLVDWFREEHNLFIKIDNFPTEEDTVDYDYCICRCDSDVDERGYMEYIIDYSLERSFTYYEALNEAIEEAFKII